MKAIVSKSIEETGKIATDWLAEATERYVNTDEAVIVGLSGHLGSGKTAFVKAVATELGITETVTSPTFVIMKIYDTTNTRWARLVHIDAYRLNGAAELTALRFDDLVADKHNLIMVEWPEQIEGFVRPGAPHETITLEVAAAETGDGRRISFQ